MTASYFTALFRISWFRQAVRWGGTGGPGHRIRDEFGEGLRHDRQGYLAWRTPSQYGGLPVLYYGSRNPMVRQ